MSTHSIWPQICSRVQPRLGIGPPFTGELSDSGQTVIASSSPSPAFFDWLIEHALYPSAGSSCQILLGIDPSRGTIGLGNGLRRLLRLREASSGSEPPRDFEVWLLTPALLGGAAPRFELALMTLDQGGTHVSLGTSPGFGLGTHTTGDLNVYMPLDPTLSNDVREFLLAMWSIAVPLSPALCEVPDLYPPRGNEEGQIHWRAYEAQIGHALGAAKPTIADVPQLADGSLDEQALVHAAGDVAGEVMVKALNRAVPPVSPLQVKLTDLFARGSLMAVGQQAKPLSVPVPPSMFGQESEVRIGAVKQRQTFSIELFADAPTRGRIEKLRTGTSDLLKRFSYSFGHGRYWVPDGARNALKAALEQLAARAGEEFNEAVQGDATRFLSGREAAIDADLKAFFGKLFPGRTMPSRTTSDVLDLLKKRIESIQGGGFMPELSASRVSFEPKAADVPSHWNDALTLVRAVLTLPRELLSERYPDSAIKASGLSVPAYLKVMNVISDGLVASVTDDNWHASSTARVAEEQLRVIDQVASSDLGQQDKLQRLLDFAAASAL